MQLGMIGLGRMGSNMVRRLLKAGHNGVVFDVSPKAVEELVRKKEAGAFVQTSDHMEETWYRSSTPPKGRVGRCPQTSQTRLIIRQFFVLYLRF